MNWPEQSEQEAHTGVLDAFTMPHAVNALGLALAHDEAAASSQIRDSSAMRTRLGHWRTTRCAGCTRRCPQACKGAPQGAKIAPPKWWRKSCRCLDTPKHQVSHSTRRNSSSAAAISSTDVSVAEDHLSESSDDIEFDGAMVAAHTTVDLYSLRGRAMGHRCAAVQQV